MRNNSHLKSEDINIEDIANYLNDLENIDSFFILERGDCSYLQCINYNGNVLIEERVYKNNKFKHYVLGHNTTEYNNKDYEDDINFLDENNNKMDSLDNDSNIKVNSLDDDNSIKLDNNENIIFNIGTKKEKYSSGNDKLAINDNFFKRFKNELFTLDEAIGIFTDYYTTISFENITKRDITNEFGNLEEGFIFIKWLDSAVDNFNENLDEFIEIIEPFVIDELKKDCVGRKIKVDFDLNIPKNENIEENNIKCSVFKVIDIFWAIESIIEVGKKYEFLHDIVIYKKNTIDARDFIKINIEDFN